jgi:TolB protein
MPTGDELVIVFDKSPESGDLDVYRLRIGDGAVTPLTTTPRDDGTPALSPDGSKIAFQSDRNGGCLFVMDVDGSNVARVTTGCSKGFPKAWAPDGTLIGWAGARRSDFDQPRDIQIIRPDGGGRTRLTDSNDIFDLAWGPSP